MSPADGSIAPSRGARPALRALKVARAALAAEAQAVAAQADLLDADFERMVGYFADADSAVFVSGIGKSGLVARRIAGTLASIGFRATSLPPSDGLHGEVGQMRRGDVLLAISKSGATDELVALARAAKDRGARIAAMTCRVPSALARMADWTLRIQTGPEAADVELPTASSIAMAALGDSLAVALIDATGFDIEDFARNHPAGNLGALLASEVDDLMRRAPAEVALVNEESDVSTVLVAMTEHPSGAALVTDADGRLAGIVTDGDIRRGLEQGPEAFLRSRVGDIMNRNPITCRSGSSAVEALRLMESGRQKVYVLPVVDQSRSILGLVRMHDLASAQLRVLDADD